MRRLALLALAALLAAGCGGHRAPATDAAQLVPAGARAYVVVEPKTLARARAELPRFGTPAEAIPYLRAGATARLRGGIVSFAKPADEKAFSARLDRRGVAHANVRGWVVYAQTQALVDAVRHSPRSLADTARYRTAFGTLPRDASVRAYEPRRRGWQAAALSLDPHAAKLEIHRPHAQPATPPSSLASEIPAGAVAAISGTAGVLPPGAEPVVGGLATLVGADVGSLIAAAPGAYVLYAIPGAPVPDVTFASAGGSSAFAKALRRAAVQLAGGPVPKPPAAIDLGPVTLHYGPIAGQLVLSDADDPAAELLGGEKLAGGKTFRDAAQAAGLPQVNDGFFYVDARRALAGARTLAALANRPVPAAVERTLAPLRALLDWAGTADGVHTVAYLRMS